MRRSGEPARSIKGDSNLGRNYGTVITNRAHNQRRILQPSAAAANRITEEERKIQLYNTSLLKILTISHSVAAAHHCCKHCHHLLHPPAVYRFKYVDYLEGQSVF